MKRILVILLVALIGALVALAASQGGRSYAGVPVMAIATLMAFGINWLVFIPSAAARTEKYYDLTGSFTYISVVLVSFLLAAPESTRAFVVTGLVIIWALRLGSFLFLRISKDGHDSRFDAIKVNPLRFLTAWTLQGLWVLLTLACALVIITSQKQVGLDLWFWLGLAIWGLGFGIEVAADRQKSAFRANSKNKDKFITTGLWAWARHPNYFGEITLWSGIAIMALPVISGWQWVSLISPVFVFLLLTKVSGIPLLTRKAKTKWGDDPQWQAYFANTPALIPRPPKWKKFAQPASELQTGK